MTAMRVTMPLSYEIRMWVGPRAFLKYPTSHSNMQAGVRNCSIHWCLTRIYLCLGASWVSTVAIYSLASHVQDGGDEKSRKLNQSIKVVVKKIIK